MKINIKKFSAILLFIVSGGVNASICNIVPGSVTCGKGTVENISGNGMVTVNGTTISGKTLVNGLLNAKDSKFFSLEVSGSTKISKCTINEVATIKGSLVAFSTKFEKQLDVFSNEMHFINSKVKHNLHLGHTDSKKQIVYLDKLSEVSGNIIFDDGDGEVIVSGQSKIRGKVIGGHVITK